MPLVSLQERLRSISAGLAVAVPNDGFRVLAGDSTESGISIGSEEGQRAIDPLLNDVDLVIFDNLSTLCTNGSESASDAWVPMQNWLLKSRRQGVSEETARRALDVAFESPATRIKIEFQGGEPLLNFPLISTIVSEAKTKAAVADKKVDFVIASNLALLDDTILAFCKANDVLLSTSLDGPRDLHNKNRPRRGGNSYELATQGIRRAQAVLGAQRIGALMTTTEASLDRVEDIVDEYLHLDLDGIFLRPLSPYGFAIKTRAFRKYDTTDWLAFYKRGLKYILEINRRGRHFPEFYSTLILKRMLTDRPLGYVDLRSPAGIGLGALVYNYDGKVFASDEGRMLAEMGDNTFELGQVTDSYRSLVLSDKLIHLIGSSLTQCAPECSDCVFEAHCGADPVYHHATQADSIGIKPLSEFCARQKGVMRLLLELLENSPHDAAILRRWGGM
jgi:His-Xaa-Ser system radical SAM maturase HxsB